MPRAIINKPKNRKALPRKKRRDLRIFILIFLVCLFAVGGLFFGPELKAWLDKNVTGNGDKNTGAALIGNGKKIPDDASGRKIKTHSNAVDSNLEVNSEDEYGNSDRDYLNKIIKNH